MRYLILILSLGCQADTDRECAAVTICDQYIADYDGCLWAYDLGVVDAWHGYSHRMNPDVPSTLDGYTQGHADGEAGVGCAAWER